MKKFSAYDFNSPKTIFTGIPYGASYSGSRPPVRLTSNLNIIPLGYGPDVLWSLGGKTTIEFTMKRRYLKTTKPVHIDRVPPEKCLRTSLSSNANGIHIYWSFLLKTNALLNSLTSHFTDWTHPPEVNYRLHITT